MTIARRLRRALAALGLVMAFVLAQGATSTAGAAELIAELSPSRISLGEAAVLRIAAADGNQPATPSVAGLSIAPTGQSTEMTSVNGAVSQHTWRLYQVVAARPGTYTIPVGGESLQLQVAAAGAASASAVDAEQAASQQPGSLALLRVTLPKGKLYVGQSVPMTFKAYFRAGTEVTLSGPPNLGIPAFTISELSEMPRQSSETIGGVPYRVATWTGLVSAAMPGSYPTNVTLPIVARYREPVRRAARDPFAGMLDDDDSLRSSALLRSLMSRSFFGGDLFGQLRERELTLHAPAQAVEVLPLPDPGKPANFTGAVGHFDVHTTVEPSAGTAFEPMNLKIVIAGHGNFDRVATAGLPSTPTWKSYPPSAHFTPSGSATTVSGTKVFEQAVVPQGSGLVQLPAVSFSFFDPEQGQYFTRTTAPITVRVAAAAAGSVAAAVPGGPSGATTAPPDQLRPNRLAEGPYVATLLPPYRRAEFWLVLLGPLLALTFLLIQSRPSRSPSARAQRQALRTAIAQRRMEMRQAAGARDPVRFFAAAQLALQTELGQKWGLAPEEVTATAVDSRMGQAGAPIVAVLRTAEQIRYAGQMSVLSSLTEYEKTIEHQLDQLENRP